MDCQCQDTWIVFLFLFLAYDHSAVNKEDWWALVIRRMLHLSAWKSMAQVSSYLTSSFKSSCSWRQSCVDLVPYMMQSSAKSLVFELTVSGISFINPCPAEPR